MRGSYTWQEVTLNNEMRKLWEQHVYWTRFFIISTAADLGDIEPVTERLLQNPVDFAAVLTPFYGAKISNDFKDLFTQHLLIAGDLVNAAKNNDSVKVNEARRKWYINADDIAKFLAGINPFWAQKKWKTMLYDHLRMTEKEATLRLSGKYAEDIQMFDRIEKEALIMADYMSHGIMQQFHVC